LTYDAYNMIAQKRHIADNGKKVPAAKGLPLIGQSLKVAKDPLLLLKELSLQYGDVVKVRLGLKDFYLIQTPAAAKHVLQEGARNYYKPGAAKLMKKVLGDGLATSNGDLWLRQRRLMQPAFHRERLKHFFDILQNEISSLVKGWREKETHQPVDVSKAFLQLTLNNLTKAMFGAGIEGRMDEIARVLRIMLDFSSDHVKQLIKIPLIVPTKNNRRFRSAEEQFEKIIYGFIQDRQKEQKTDPSIEHDDLLQLLLTAYDGGSHASMTAKQLRDEITTIFMAGHETTSQTLSWIFYRLALHPEIYRQVREEAAQMSSSVLTLDMLQQLSYTKSLIEEAMRFYPPVWIIARKATAADTINSYHLPAGATVLINVYGMHHHPAYWNKPDTFDPSHFCARAKENVPPFLYLPFGGGQRLCIGHHFAMMVMQTVIVRLVHEFSFSVPAFFVPTIDANLTLRAKEGIQLVIQQTNTYADTDSTTWLC
jgi:cytochrome P450